MKLIDDYRCAGESEFGICSKRVPACKGSLAPATLAMLRHHLLTEDHATLFVEE